MKTLRLAPLLCGFTLTVLGQGPLSPPAAPAPTMKALDQIEPRKVVNAANTPGDATSTFVISQPGSYYLAGNLAGESGKHGISIRANSVALDLGGFELAGGGGTSRGVDVPAQQFGLEIRNGAVRGWTDGGVRAENALILAEKLRLLDNGDAGLRAGNGSLVKDCAARNNAVGFRGDDRSQFTNCISTVNTGNGFEVTNYVTLLDCTASRNAGGGFVVGGTTLMQRCSATRNDLAGIQFGAGSTITDCTAGANIGAGFTGTGSTLSRCTATSNGFAGTSTRLPGILSPSSSVSRCTSSANAANGISATSGSVMGCVAENNGRNGILADFGSVTNSSASNNGWNGIQSTGGVVAFCRASGNNQAGNGSSDIDSSGGTRTGNNPAP